MERKPSFTRLLLEPSLYDVRDLERLNRLVIQFSKRVGEAAPRELRVSHALPVIDVVPIEETFRPVGDYATRVVQRVRSRFLRRRRRQGEA